MIISDFELSIVALCIWREARGEDIEGMRAVAHVINNRHKLGEPLLSVVTRKWQFSSMTAPNDSQLVMYPDYGTLLGDLVGIVTTVFNDEDSDVTNGATHYFNPSVVLPTWATKMTFIKSIGHHDFYKA